MQTHHKIRLIGFLTTTLIGTAAVSGATLCVDPSDASCSATIQAAVDAAVAADTIEIAKGLYFESVLIPAGKDGLVLTGGGTVDPHGIPAEPNEPDPAAIRVESNAVRIDGLLVQNGRGNGIEAVANGLILNKVVVRGPENNCVHVQGNDLVVSASVVRGCGNNNLDIEGDRAQVLKTKVSQCDSDCIQIDGNDAVLEGNVVTGAEDGTSVSVNGDGLKLRKNRISNGDNDGLRLSGDNAVIESNKFTGIDENAIDLVGDNPTIRKNSVSTVTERAIDIYCQPCTGGLVVKNKVVNASGDADCFEIYVEGDDPNEPSSPPTNPFVVEGNSATRCADAGYVLVGNGITLRKNSAKDCGGDESEEGFDIGGTGHILEENRSTGNFSSGFTIEGTGHTLTGNKAAGNLGDGFQIDGLSGFGGHTLTENKSTDNLGQGFAVKVFDPNDPPGSSTLTSNSASGNRTDFCADAGANPTLTDNAFASTANDCLEFD